MKQFKIFIIGIAILSIAFMSFIPADKPASAYYKFALKTNEVYTPLVNKTIFQIGNQLNTDEVSSEITLPFDFVIYGNAENKMQILNNGAVCFGTPLTSRSVTVFNAISSTNMPCNELISFSNQITASTAIGALPEISHGLNSFGDYVIQFQDVSIVNAPGVRMTFQFILKSDSSTIQIMFGPNCKGQDQISNISPRGFEVGPRGIQTPRVNSTPYTTTCDNLTIGSGDWNKLLLKPGQSGGVNYGTTPSSTMSPRTGVNIPGGTPTSNMVTVGKMGTIFQWSVNQ